MAKVDQSSDLGFGIYDLRFGILMCRYVYWEPCSSLEETAYSSAQYLQANTSYYY